ESWIHASRVVETPKEENCRDDGGHGQRHLAADEDRPDAIRATIARLAALVDGRDDTVRGCVHRRRKREEDARDDRRENGKRDLLSLKTRRQGDGILLERQQPSQRI